MMTDQKQFQSSRRRFPQAVVASAGLLQDSWCSQSGISHVAISPLCFHPVLCELEKQALSNVTIPEPHLYWGDGNGQGKEFSARRLYGYLLCSGVTQEPLHSTVPLPLEWVRDEVIVPAYSWWSDYTCVINAGALPVFADIDASFNLDPEDFERKITPRTKAVLAVHLIGGPCDMDPIMEIARKHNIKVLEDCAQCVGGAYKGKKLGSIGDIGIYSFQINKMISSGEGGAVVTNDPYLYERACRFHDMGDMRRVFEERLGEIKGPHVSGKIIE